MNMGKIRGDEFIRKVVELRGDQSRSQTLFLIASGDLPPPEGSEIHRKLKSLGVRWRWHEKSTAPGTASYGEDFVAFVLDSRVKVKMTPQIDPKIRNSLCFLFARSIIHDLRNALMLVYSLFTVPSEEIDIRKYIPDIAACLEKIKEIFDDLNNMVSIIENPAGAELNQLQSLRLLKEIMRKHEDFKNHFSPADIGQLARLANFALVFSSAYRQPLEIIGNYLDKKPEIIDASWAEELKTAERQISRLNSLFHLDSSSNQEFGQEKDKIEFEQERNRIMSLYYLLSDQDDQPRA